MLYRWCKVPSYRLYDKNTSTYFPTLISTLCIKASVPISEDKEKLKLMQLFTGSVFKEAAPKARRPTEALVAKDTTS